MSRREELAAVRERDRERNPRCRWTYVAVDGTPSECGDSFSVHEAKGNTHEFVGPDDWADRRFLLGLVDELAAAARAREKAEEVYADAEDTYNNSHNPTQARRLLQIDRLATERAEAILALRDLLSDLGPDA